MFDKILFSLLVNFLALTLKISLERLYVDIPSACAVKPYAYVYVPSLCAARAVAIVYHPYVCDASFADNVPFPSACDALPNACVFSPSV